MCTRAMTQRQNLVFMLRSALTLGPVERNDVGYSIKEVKFHPFKKMHNYKITL